MLSISSGRALILLSPIFNDANADRDRSYIGNSYISLCAISKRCKEINLAKFLVIFFNESFVKRNSKSCGYSPNHSGSWFIPVKDIFSLLRFTKLFMDVGKVWIFVCERLISSNFVQFPNYLGKAVIQLSFRYSSDKFEHSPRWGSY